MNWTVSFKTARNMLSCASGNVVGALMSWHFDAGGGSPFLRDAIVLELAGSADLVTACFGKVEELCTEHGVSVARR